MAGLIELRSADRINSTAMTQIFEKMVEDPSDASSLAESLNLLQVSDEGFLEPIVDRVLSENPDEVEKYKSGKTALIGFFIGKIMQLSGGKANPEQARKALLDKLS
jgi:aspartyl-tRNA(Asn)/glutamyl-tRNA(Gln) amidotransferase subunit B